MKFLKNNSPEEVLRNSSCTHKCGGDCHNETEHKGKEKGSTRKEPNS